MGLDHVLLLKSYNFCHIFIGTYALVAAPLQLQHPTQAWVTRVQQVSTALLVSWLNSAVILEHIKQMKDKTTVQCVQLEWCVKNRIWQSQTHADQVNSPVLVPKCQVNIVTWMYMEVRKTSGESEIVVENNMLLVICEMVSN